MIFQSKVDKALKDLNDDRKQEDFIETLERRGKEPEPMDLEKSDRLAMVISAFIVILPIALVILGLLALTGILFVSH